MHAETYSKKGQPFSTEFDAKTGAPSAEAVIGDR